MIAEIREEADRKLREWQKAQEAERAEAKQAAEKVAERERALSDREAAFQAQLNAALAKERTKIAEEERANARKELAPDLEANASRIKELEAGLEKSRAAELALLKEKNALEDRAKNLDLEVLQKVNAERKAIQDQAAKDEAEKTRLKELEYEKRIQDMRDKIAEAERKATQGSQQLQGDVLEIDFESALRQAFPQDTVAAVKAGARGGDILQHVLGEMGRPVGTLFWEIKRTSAWSDGWVAKAKKDAAEAKAEVVIIASDNLPKDIREFGLYDGVWVVRPTYGVMLAAALRQGVVNVSEARQRALGKETKAERLYEYMMGPEFRAMLEGIALPFVEFQSELEAEKRATLTRWRRQEKRIARVLESVTGLKGDLQGIGGTDMPELPGFEDGYVPRNTDNGAHGPASEPANLAGINESQRLYKDLNDEEPQAGITDEGTTATKNYPGADATVAGRTPYAAWGGKPGADPREAPLKSSLAHLAEIVQVEGPIKRDRLARLFAQDCGFKRIRESLREVIDLTVESAISQGLIQHPDTFDGDDVLVVPGQPSTLPRETGPRTIWEIPQSEINAQVLGSAPYLDLEAKVRLVLESHGLKKMTKGVSAYIVASLEERRLNEEHEEEGEE